MSIKIYKILSAALANGVYSCQEQCLLATGWEAGHGDKFDNPPAWIVDHDYIAGVMVTGSEDKFYKSKSIHHSTSENEPGVGINWENCWELINPVEILNLLENYTVGDYTRALAAGDRMMAWPSKDCAGNSVLIGRPITPDVRMARTTEDAGGSQHITCNLIANDGETEIESGLGSGIEVYFKPTNAVNMNNASPKFANDNYLFVQNINGKWLFVDVPQSLEECANPPP